MLTPCKARLIPFVLVEYSQAAALELPVNQPKEGTMFIPLEDFSKRRTS